MIKINNKRYDSYDYKIVWGNYDAVILGKRNTGVSPFIKFNIEDNIFIGIETVFSKELIKSMNVNEKFCLNSYITDITYEDEKGWVSIITSKYNCELIKLGENRFILELTVDSSEIDNLNINVNSNIKFD